MGQDKKQHWFLPGGDPVTPVGDVVIYYSQIPGSSEVEEFPAIIVKLLDEQGTCQLVVFKETMIDFGTAEFTVDNKPGCWNFKKRNYVANYFAGIDPIGRRGNSDYVRQFTEMHERFRSNLHKEMGRTEMPSVSEQIRILEVLDPGLDKENNQLLYPITIKTSKPLIDKHPYRVASNPNMTWIAMIPLDSNKDDPNRELQYFMRPYVFIKGKESPMLSVNDILFPYNH